MDVDELVAEFFKELIKLAVGLALVSYTAKVTVRRSMREFYSQKWWEKKEGAYFHIVEQLLLMEYSLDVWTRDLELPGSVSLAASEKKKLNERYSKAVMQVKMAAAAGAFIVSDDTAKSLSALVRSLEEREENLFEEIESHWVSVRQCIEEVGKQAELELRKGRFASLAPAKEQGFERVFCRDKRKNPGDAE